MTELSLDCGIDVWLHELNQRLTYEGLLEGAPIRRLNEGRVAEILELARARPLPVPVTLIEPVVRPVAGGADSPFGPAEALPRVAVSARFRAYCCTPRAEDGDTYSELVVVWFQATFAPPIEPAVIERIRALDWHALAGDFGD